MRSCIVMVRLMKPIFEDVGDKIIFKFQCRTRTIQALALRSSTRVTVQAQTRNSTTVYGDHMGGCV